MSAGGKKPKSAETKKRMSSGSTLRWAEGRGYVQKPEQAQKRKATIHARGGFYKHTDDFKKATSKRHKGKVISPEQRAKQKATFASRSSGARQKTSIAISEAALLRWFYEYDDLCAAMRGKKMPPKAAGYLSPLKGKSCDAATRSHMATAASSMWSAVDTEYRLWRGYLVSQGQLRRNARLTLAEKRIEAQRRGDARLRTGGKNTQLERKLRCLLSITQISYEAQYATEAAVCVDTFVPPLNLIIECDGHWHETPEACAADALRDSIHAKLGYQTLRLTGKQINGPLCYDLLIAGLAAAGYQP